MAVFTVNYNPDESVIHLEHPHEICNVDDSKDSEKVDEMTARALMEHGAARPCQHCKPFAERP